jgi:hypothetical protein
MRKETTFYMILNGNSVDFLATIKIKIKNLSSFKIIFQALQPNTYVYQEKFTLPA